MSAVGATWDLTIQCCLRMEVSAATYRCCVLLVLLVFSVAVLTLTNSLCPGDAEGTNSTSNTLYVTATSLSSHSSNNTTNGSWRVESALPIRLQPNEYRAHPMQANPKPGSDSPRHFSEDMRWTSCIQEIFKTSIISEKAISCLAKPSPQTSSTGYGKGQCRIIT